MLRCLLSLGCLRSDDHAHVISIVCLGATRAELAGNAESIARTPYGAIRLGQPDDIARAVAFLASDHATFIVGENLMVDGGYKAS